MNITFDTHYAVKSITESGLSDTQAEAIVTTINNAMNQNLATKADIVSLKAEMLVLKWMVGLVIAVEVLPLLKVLFA